MGSPSMQGTPAASAAQHAEKSFPAGTDASEVSAAMASARTSDAGFRDGGMPQAARTPVTPEIRQVTPAADMGAGYGEATQDDPR